MIITSNCLRTSRPTKGKAYHWVHCPNAFWTQAGMGHQPPHFEACSSICHLHNKEMSPSVQREPHLAQLCAAPLHPIIRYHEQSPAPPSVFLPQEVVESEFTVSSLLGLLFSTLDIPSVLSLSSQDMFSSSVIRIVLTPDQSLGDVAKIWWLVEGRNPAGTKWSGWGWFGEQKSKKK